VILEGGYDVSYKQHFTAKALFVRWVNPELGDHDGIYKEVCRRFAADGKLSALVTIVPPEVPLPDDAFRKAGVEAMQKGKPYVDAYHLVIEGQGMRFSAMRTVASLISVVSGTGKQAFIAANLEESLARLAPPGPTRASVLAALQQAGVA
jgi:hypothetical protein